MSHVERVKEAMSGHGIDRHLLALREVLLVKHLSAKADLCATAHQRAHGARQVGCKASERHAALEVWAEQIPVMIESSQAPAQRGPSGGFGTSQAGGFAVSYSIREDNMYLHVCHRRPEGQQDPVPPPAASAIVGWGFASARASASPPTAAAATEAEGGAG